MNIYKLNGQLLRLVHVAAFKVFNNPAKAIKEVKGNRMYTKDGKVYEVKIEEVNR